MSAIFDTAKSNVFDTAKSNVFDTAKSNVFDTAKSNKLYIKKNHLRRTIKEEIYKYSACITDPYGLRFA